jgi:peptidoglycan/LPS O-acetylase OafA/YrhL
MLSIDVLRGVAALAVVTTHAFPHELTYLAIQSPWFGQLGAGVARGILGVPLFFVISGFCIHLRWASRRQPVKWGAFWKRRLRRLYPPYFVVLLGCLVMVLVAATLGRAVYYPEPKARWIALDFAAHVFMLHGFHPLFDVGASNPPMWTLAREEYFYLLYFGLLAWRRTRGLAATVALAAIVGLAYQPIARALLPASITDVGYPSAFVLWIQWVLGMVAVEAHYGVLRLPRLFRAWWMVPIWFAASEVGQVYGGAAVAAILWGVTFFTLVNTCLDADRRSPWSSRKICVRLANVGVFSYSLYLTHYPVVMIVRELSGALAHPANAWVALGGTGLKIMVCVAVAKLFFHVVERRFLNTPPPIYVVEDRTSRSSMSVSAVGLH